MPTFMAIQRDQLFDRLSETERNAYSHVVYFHLLDIGPANPNNPMVADRKRRGDTVARLKERLTMILGDTGWRMGRRVTAYEAVYVTEDRMARLRLAFSASTLEHGIVRRIVDVRDP